MRGAQVASAPRLGWRKAKGRFFLALGVLSLVIALGLIAILVVSTWLEAVNLVNMNAAAHAGLSFSNAGYQERQPNGNSISHAYVISGPPIEGSQMAELGVVEGTAITQLGDEVMRDPAQVWDWIAASGQSEFRAPVNWVPKSRELIGNLGLERIPDVVGIYWARVESLAPGSPAERAGLRVGDIITAADGHPIIGPSNAWDAIVYAAQRTDGTDPVTLSVERDGETIPIEMQAEYSAQITISRDPVRAVWYMLTHITSASFPERGGILSGLVGTVLVIGVMIVVAFPLGAMTAIYLEEYATRNVFTESLQVLIANLAGIPSIAYGLMALAVFAHYFRLGSSVLTGGLALGLVILPIMIVSAREALRAVPPSIREAAYGVGATRWQVIRHQVLPNAMPGMFTGMILSLAQAIGETAPLLMLGAAIFISFVPDGLFSRFTVIPLQIYSWALHPKDGFDALTAAAVLLLLLIMVLLNLVAIWLRNRFQRSW